MRVPKAEILFSSVFFAFSAFVVWQSVEYGLFSTTITGPGFFPAIAGAIMLVSTGAAIVSTLKGRRGEASAAFSSAAAGPGDGKAAGIGVEVLRVALIVSLTVLLILLAPYVGMIAITPFYIFASFLALAPDFKPRRLAIGAATAISFTVIAWALFDRALGVPMPRGVIWG